MTIEIHRPEHEELIMQRMKTGGFTSVEDALQHALETSPVVATDATTASKRTGADLIVAMQSSPFREAAIEPARHRTPVRDVTF